MNDIAYLFWALVFVAGVAAFLLRDIHDDDPRHDASYEPPRSHHDDPFSRTGASFH